VTIDSCYYRLLCFIKYVLFIFLIKKDRVTNPIHAERNNTVIEPGTGDSPCY